RRIGVVFQDYQLITTKTVFDNIAFAMEVINKSRKDINERVREVLDIIELSAEFNNYPDQLSGGQQQRVVIGRAIANNPKLIIADEPTGNLDPRRSKEIIELLEKINRQGTTIIVVTHNDILVNTYRKRTITLENGYIVNDNPEGGYYNV
ncbi:MAG: ATP-binding cassette domain-containing protein, partial [Erysipelotrichaceae bacterium]|nr:ATP-binding cassette domain-containing protein [Erysipelotrichaceae bacterium]